MYLLSCLVAMSGPVGAPDLGVSAPIAATATIRSDALEPGETYAIRLRLKLPGDPNVKVMQSGRGAIRAPLLLIDAPESIELLDAEPADQSRQGKSQANFLRMPYGRRIIKDITRVDFRLLKEPGPEETIGLNIVTYLDGDGAASAQFVRERIELPLKPKARAKARRSDDSRWGPDDGLDIGDAAPGFELPQDEETVVSLESFRGKKHVIVTTYRAFW